jgi:glycine cleavage system regulatory protein
VTQKVAQSTAITLIATDREKLDKIKALWATKTQQAIDIIMKDSKMTWDQKTAYINYLRK